MFLFFIQIKLHWYMGGGNLSLAKPIDDDKGLRQFIYISSKVLTFWEYPEPYEIPRRSISLPRT